MAAVVSDEVEMESVWRVTTRDVGTPNGISSS
jgi:hypothetical protein